MLCSKEIQENLKKARSSLRAFLVLGQSIPALCIEFYKHEKQDCKAK